MTTDHDARIERAAKAIEACMFQEDGMYSPRDMARAALTAAGTAPGEAQPDLTTAYLLGESRGRDAGTVQGLDELLDSVHPEATVDLGIIRPEYQHTGRWGVTIFVPSGTTWESTHKVNGLVTRYEGTGPTRMDAIRNAVAQATGIAQEGAGDE